MTEGARHLRTLQRNDNGAGIGKVSSLATSVDIF